MRGLATIVVPTSWAVSTGSSAVLLLSDVTPGPVLGHPWRTLAGIRQVVQLDVDLHHIPRLR